MRGPIPVKGLLGSSIAAAASSFRHASIRSRPKARASGRCTLESVQPGPAISVAFCAVLADALEQARVAQ